VPANIFAAAANCGKMLGCATEDLERIHGPDFRCVTRSIANIEFPAFVQPSQDKDRAITPAVVRYPNRPILLKIRPSSLTGVCSYDWTALVPVVMPDIKADYEPMRFIVAAYIQHVLRNRLTVPTTDSNLILAVLQDLHKWLENAYGGTFNYAAAENTLITPNKAHIVLMHELNNAINAEEITVLPRPRQRMQASNYVLRTKAHWWLNQKAVDKYFKAFSVVPNWNALLNCFTQEGVFCGEETVHNMPGLLIERDWCDTFWSEYSDTTAKDVG
jgi:hypothetical protein